MIKVDGHIHTPFCPHGSNDSFELYVEKALSHDYTQITFTEHAPLPPGFKDTTPDQDSGMKEKKLLEYFDTIKDLKEKYKGEITILAGLEVDYIESFEKETTAFLNKYGPLLDDSILSVHFLVHEGKWDCLDFSPEVFHSMVEYYGSVDHVYQRYYETVLHSIKADLGVFKPKRIGHMTLARKFQKLYPPSNPFKEEIEGILKEVASRNYELDYNGAGFVKPYCGESYPPLDVIQKARSLNIKTVYGSDAHQSAGIDQGRKRMNI
ncbi:histidinol-phosphatase HisJ [Rossellomorea aquimaris]|uniref:histidinol-phosphatase HisJ n=1 Tax=Rossellomorea aquimaris TaxID=189382 RepID=UPI0007D0891A|nr:histidinol-phosphatase HisJ [Rossellomorea aquimaris]